MAQIIVTHGVPTKGLELLNEHTVHYPGTFNVFSREEMLNLVPTADAIIACGALPAEMIEAAPRLKIIANYGAGYDSVDVKAATQRGIPVTNTPDETREPTAEVAIGLMLAASRRICELNQRLRNEETSRVFGMGRHMGMGLKGNTLGIIGMGHIGGIVAEFGKLMGMRVVYHNRKPATNDHGAAYVSLEELLQSSQIVSIHCPLNDSTRNLISAERLGLMQERAILINTARGPVVDYEALAKRLRENKLMAAGLDVFHQEPNIPDDLLKLPNVVLTPHVGTNTQEARCEMISACCRRILDALAGKRPEHVVNPAIYESTL